MPQCHQCNAALPAGAKFCGRCGTPVPASTASASTASASQTDPPATAPVSYPPPAPPAPSWASDPTQAVGGTPVQQRDPEPGQQWGSPAQRPGTEPTQQWGSAAQQRDPEAAQQWGGQAQQQRDPEAAQQWGGQAQQQRDPEPAQQWGGSQWGQPQAYQPPAPAYQPPSPGYQQGAPAYPAPGVPYQPAGQRPGTGPAIAGGVMAIAGALGVVGACALPVTNSNLGFGGGGSISLFKELGTHSAWWYLVEPIGVAVLAIVAAIITMAARGRALPVAAAGILIGFGLQTVFLFLGYWRGFAEGQQSGPAGIVGMLAGVLLVGAGLVAGAAVRRT